MSIIIKQQIKMRSTELPAYLSGIINTSYKHRQVESIKEQIKKLLPEGFIPPPPHKKIERNARDCELRKTVSNFGQISSVRFDQDNLAFMHPKQQFTLYQRKFSDKKEHNQLNRLSEKIDSGNEEQGEHMTDWREEMMKHFKPQRQINLEKKNQPAPSINRHRKGLEEKEMKLFKVRTSTPMMRSKFKSTLNQNGTSSQKKFILIKPTIVSTEENSIKKLFTIKTKVSRSDNHLPPTHWNDLAHQRIANFKALLPYLGTHKAKVELKPQRKDASIVYEPSQSLRQQKVVRESKRKQNVYQGKISGWQTED